MVFSWVPELKDEYIDGALFSLFHLLDREQVYLVEIVIREHFAEKTDQETGRADDETTQVLVHSEGSYS